MCFNRLGDFTCIDTPCPVSFKRNEKNGFCVKQCPPGSNCSNRPISAIEYKTIGTCCTQLAHTHCIQLFQRAFKPVRIWYVWWRWLKTVTSIPIHDSLFWRLRTKSLFHFLSGMIQAFNSDFRLALRIKKQNGLFTWPVATNVLL